ncbi:sigma-70 family RNA polymerase sigma factor [Parapusillimonas sp. SGNA-6]|uniref:RNA polymerase sigma factor n=1 Tax=Parapedobacter sp. SGR-10 TaxID=2710879 RepID=UPI0013CFC35D|nr:sigma-70 family RNA polymerase sigma factor [Parapedobacter sp. SGR-10]NGF56698.1 sigma-70 family RNA polymerase sigma factor [Parapedobacter sp. SGR-10]NGM89726.1 sigma-70 family RNA polymerase sigma factor [Parapusillimonas sp. SGNA-6]
MVNNCLCDNELLLGLKAGNQKSFSDIYEKYWKNLYNSAYKRLKNNEKSKDVVQNVFTSLWDRRQEVTIHNLSAYLHTSVKFQVYKQAIKAPQVAEFLEAFENILVSPVNTEDDVLEKEILGLIKAWIEALPPKRKKIFLLHYEDGVSTDQIAEILGISRKTVQNQLNTVSHTLRIRLSQLLALLVLIHFKG